MSHDDVVNSQKAPEPVGAYVHARKAGGLLFLAGIGPRQRGSKEIPKGIEAQTEAVIANVKTVLTEAGSSMEKIVDVQVFLTNMKNDFAIFNKVYEKHFKDIPATRTTVEVGALPTPIAVEFKVIATL
jgi:2-aminomuconate deaminase